MKIQALKQVVETEKHMKEELERENEKRMATLTQASKDQAKSNNALEKDNMELRDELNKAIERLTAHNQQLMKEKNDLELQLQEQVMKEAFKSAKSDPVIPSRPVSNHYRNQSSLVDDQHLTENDLLKVLEAITTVTDCCVLKN